MPPILLTIQQSIFVNWLHLPESCLQSNIFLKDVRCRNFPNAFSKNKPKSDCLNADHFWATILSHYHNGDKLWTVLYIKYPFAALHSNRVVIIFRRPCWLSEMHLWFRKIPLHDLMVTRIWCNNFNRLSLNGFSVF